MKVIVIGSGIIGLSTAHTLLDEGCVVKIISRDLPQQTTSWRAAAIWFPYQAHPLDKVIRWSQYSFTKYLDYVDRADTGVSMVPLRVMESASDVASWIDALPGANFRNIPEIELPTGYGEGVEVDVPMIDTSLFLPFLLSTFLIRGGEFELGSVDGFTKMKSEADWVINCTGLASRELCKDTKLYPIRGQIVKVKPQKGLKYIAADHGPLALSYIIPRKHEVVLGGTAQRNLENTAVDATETRRIIERCMGLSPDLDPIILQSEVGLRPGRSEIRLELEHSEQLIHNYGHGGSGFTVCWGCASDILVLMGVQPKSPT
ncbi:MAG: FAD-binding oxidoreductase [Saprospiraceae bacterium]|nr:FAD-binding oxidoreductase [Saprospiraceae bacterium]